MVGAVEEAVVDQAGQIHKDESSSRLNAPWRRPPTHSKSVAMWEA